MKFNIARAPVELIDATPQPGDVYLARGGKHGAGFHVIVSVSDSGGTVHTLSLSRLGEIVGAGHWGAHVFERRDKVGFASLPETIDVQWLGQP